MNTNYANKCTFEIVKRGYGYYAIHCYFNHSEVFCGYASNIKNAKIIGKKFNHPNEQYSQIGKEIVKL